MANALTSHKAGHTPEDTLNHHFASPVSSYNADRRE